MNDKREQRRLEAQRRLLEFLALAVLIHLAALPLLSHLVPDAGPPLGERRSVRMVSLSRADMAKNRRVERPRAQPKRDDPEEPKKEEEKLADLKGQVVDIPPSPDDTPPEDAKYLSEHNTRTERETRSRHQTAHAENSLNERSTTQRAAMASPKAQEAAKALEVGPDNATEQPTQQQAPPRFAFELPKQDQRDRLRLKLDSTLGQLNNREEVEKIEGKGNRLKLALGSESEGQEAPGAAPNRAPTMAELVPELGVLARLNGAPTNDYLQDLDEGEGTFLNSREFKYASFFNRMKRGVSQQWHPLAEYRRRDPTGNIYGTRSRVTILSVTLHANGSLKDVAVTRSSGLDFLDREAMLAFRRAEPFPNPPKGLIDGSTGDITFPFGFHIDFSPTGGLHLPF